MRQKAQNFDFIQWDSSPFFLSFISLLKKKIKKKKQTTYLL